MESIRQNPDSLARMVCRAVQLEYGVPDDQPSASESSIAERDHLGRPTLLITGLGAISPNGLGIPAFTAGLRSGRSGCSLINRERDAGVSEAYPASGRLRSSAAAICRDFVPAAHMPEHEVSKFPRLVPMALAAAREAMTMAGLEPAAEHDAEPGSADDHARASQRIGLVLGTGGGGIDFSLDQIRSALLPDERAKLSLWAITNATHGNLAGELSIRLGLRGPSHCVSTGCASSSDAMGLAMEQLRSVRPSTPAAMVVVGADAHIRWETLLGMELLKVISMRACASDEEAAAASRPFDAERDGFVLGEGAWAVVLETPEHFRRREAAARGARVLGEALGYAATCDAYHRVRPEPSMGEAVRAMREALEDAGVAPNAVRTLHYHGTGTQLNDRLETEAVKRMFGDHARRLRGTSVKSMIGHPQGASGLAALVATLAALNAMDQAGPGFVPPTINLKNPDPVCALDYTPNEPTACGGGVALINCLAFGAKNSALVVRGGCGA